MGGIYFIGVGHYFLKFPRTVQTIEFSKDTKNGLIKSRTNKIMGGLIPIKFEGCNGYWLAIPDNSSLVFYFDNNNFKICS